MTSALEREIASLKQVAATRAARHEHIEGLAWPNGMRIAVNFTLDYDAMLRRRLSNEPPLQMAKGEFGGRVGIWRLIELFDHHDIKATIFTPGRICELFPRSVQAAARSGHEIGDHMWEHRVPKEPEIERAHVARCTAALAKLAGRPPVGSRSGHSAALLREHGYIYASHRRSDLGPYYLRDADGRNCMLELPFGYSIDDAMFYNFGWLESENLAQRISDPERVLEIWWGGFMHQYRRAGGYYNVVLHPFISGRALRIVMLDKLITRMKALPGVWFPTCEEVARHILANHPPRAAAPAH